MSFPPFNFLLYMKRKKPCGCPFPNLTRASLFSLSGCTLFDSRKFYPPGRQWHVVFWYYAKQWPWLLYLPVLIIVYYLIFLKQVIHFSASISLSTRRPLPEIPPLLRCNYCFYSASSNTIKLSQAGTLHCASCTNK